jgi:hypothetical protein
MRALPNFDRNPFTTIKHAEKRTLIQTMEAAWFPADCTMLVGVHKNLNSATAPARLGKTTMPVSFLFLDLLAHQARPLYSLALVHPFFFGALE